LGVKMRIFFVPCIGVNTCIIPFCAVTLAWYGEAPVAANTG
jgi:hypothetical protein